MVRGWDLLEKKEKKIERQLLNDRFKDTFCLWNRCNGRPSFSLIFRGTVLSTSNDSHQRFSDIFWQAG